MKQRIKSKLESTTKGRTKKKKGICGKRMKKGVT